MKAIGFVTSGGIPPSTEDERQAVDLLHEMRFFGILPDCWSDAKSVFPFTELFLPPSSGWKSPLIWESKTLYFHQRYNRQCVFIDVKDHKNCLQAFQPQKVSFEEKMDKIAERLLKEYGDIPLKNLFNVFCGVNEDVDPAEIAAAINGDADGEEDLIRKLLLSFLDKTQSDSSFGQTTTMAFLEKAREMAKDAPEDMKSIIFLQNLLSFVPHGLVPDLVFEKSNKLVDRWAKSGEEPETKVASRFYLDCHPSTGHLYLRDEAGILVEDVDISVGSPIVIDVHAYNLSELIVAELPFGHTLVNVEDLDAVKQLERRTWLESLAAL